MFRSYLKKRKSSARNENMGISPSSNENRTELSPDLKRNEQILKEIFNNCTDVVIRSIHIEGFDTLLLVYACYLCNTDHLENVLLKSLSFEHQSDPFIAAEKIEERRFRLGQMIKESYITNIVKYVLNGDVAIIVEGSDHAFINRLRFSETRSIEEPPSEPSIRGPREGFIESITTNISLLRRKLRTSYLKTELFTIGDLSQTSVIISYIEGVATERVINEVRNRVSQIKIDGILDSGYIEQFIEESPFSPFPQALTTERPDVVAGQLLEGRVAIFVDGTPFVLIVPVTFWSYMQTGEDYYERILIGTAVRGLRFLFLLIAFFFPAFYVAITTFHQEMLPTSLLLSIVAARENSPFPSLIEALIMETTFEALREAGIRLPRQVGSAVSIVGVLVIGESAVRAGFVSAPLVIIVGLTGIASFTIPRYSFGMPFRILRFPIIIIAGTLGLYGMVLGMIAVLFHVNGLRSFGVPYFSPVAPLVPGNLKDVLGRTPLWSRKSRPRFIGQENTQRIPYIQKPDPDRKNDRK